MADSGSLGARAELGKVLADEHADLLREGVAPVLREVMELEVARLAGGERCERRDERAAYRNGYRPRRLDTRVGTLELEIPKLHHAMGLDSAPNLREAPTRHGVNAGGARGANERLYARKPLRLHGFSLRGDIFAHVDLELAHG